MLPPPLPMPSGPPMTPPGWHPDPWNASMLRYWDGSTWTGHQVVGPTGGMGGAAIASAHPTLPLVAALGGLVVTAAALVGSRFALIALGRFEFPVVVYVALSVIFGYGPMLAYCIWAAHRWGTGRLRDSLGFRARWVDAGWGPVAWLATYCATIPVALIVTAVKIPMKSNTEGLEGLDAERGVLIAMMIAAIVAAPFVEELLFRGVVLRGFLSVMPPWLALGTQAVVFGSAHFDPSRGIGNIGLVMVLSAAGAVFGGAAYLARRLAPSIIAHGLMNTVAMLIAVFVAG